MCSLELEFRPSDRKEKPVVECDIRCQGIKRGLKRILCDRTDLQVNFTRQYPAELHQRSADLTEVHLNLDNIQLNYSCRNTAEPNAARRCSAQVVRQCFDPTDCREVFLVLVSYSAKVWDTRTCAFPKCGVTESIAGGEWLQLAQRKGSGTDACPTSGE